MCVCVCVCVRVCVHPSINMNRLPAKHDGSTCQNPHKQWQVSEEVGHLRAHLSIETEVVDKVEAGCTAQEIQLQYKKEANQE